MKLLIIEDEQRLADSIADLLREKGFAADTAYDGAAGYGCTVTGRYDLIILDVMLPRLNGLELAKKLRKEGNETPILMLTAKAEVADRVSGLNCGADYYLPKPFHTSELLACVGALLRRQGDWSNCLSYGNTTLDVSTSVLTCGGESIRLSAREFELMKLLMAARQRNLSKEHLLTAVWGYDTDAEENHVEVYISMLRKKLAAIESNLRIEAIRRLGYHLEVTAP